MLHGAAVAGAQQRDINGLAVDLDQFDVAVVGTELRANLFDDRLDALDALRHRQRDSAGAGAAGASSAATANFSCGAFWSCGEDLFDFLVAG